MSASPHDLTPTINPLDALIASYIQAVEGGQVPNRQDLLQQNPDHAEALLTFFADFDRMDRVIAPLRMSDQMDETAAVNSTGQVSPPTVRYFGDYELLEEIARGGMGIVYKARQTSLNRLVALKMILAGTFASAREVARFQAEAEAAANLDHPHIVPVYEVGEHTGQQYFSMKFIEGGSLATYPRSDIKTEVLGLITIARAVHHAHQHGVLHRDLKPSNVLVDPRGDRHVTDFGLAKRLADVDRSLTEAGQILGTPRYMSPEQAAGRKDLTVAADIYALGVILYERLTGRTPFEGTTVLDLLRQVRESEPPRPSTIEPGLDRDLETIVLKCLDKDPTRRYLTADDLVLDLTYWSEGRPINARPVGQAERFARWCRRNPAIASLSASVAIALLLGVTLSTLFAYQERKARVRAEGAEAATEKTFAQSLARPLDPKGDEDGHESLSSPETSALWELAQLQDQPLALRFLDEATRDPIPLGQLRARSEPALIAAVGLDPVRRDRAASLLRDRLRDPKLTMGDKVEVATIALELQDRPGDFLDECVRTIIEARRAKPDVRLGPNWRVHMSNASRRIEPSAASRILLAELDQPYDPDSWLTPDLARMFDRLHPPEVDTYRKTLVDQLVAKRIGFGWELADRLNSAERLAVAQPFLEGLKRPGDYPGGRGMGMPRTDPSRMLGMGMPRTDPSRMLTFLMPRLDAVDTARILDQLVDQHDLTSWIWGNSPENLRALVSKSFLRLTPVDSERIAAKLVRRIAVKLAENPDLDDCELVARFSWVFSLAPNLPADWLPPVQALKRAIARQPKVEDQATLAWDLGPMADRLGPDEAAKVCLPVAETLTRSFEQDADKLHQNILTNGLAAMALRSPPEQARKVIRLLAMRVGRVPGDYDASNSFHSLLSDLSEDDARRSARLIVSTLDGESDPKVRWSLGAGLCLVAEKMKPAEVIEICGPVAQQMVESFLLMTSYKGNLLPGLSIVTSRLPEARRVEVVQPLLEALERKTDDNDRWWVWSAIVSSVGQGNELGARQVAEILGTRLTRGLEPGSSAIGLGVLADRIPAPELKAILVAALEREASPGVRLQLTEALAGRMPAPESKTILVAALEREADPGVRRELTKALQALTGRVPAAELGAVLAAALERETDFNCYGVIRDSLLAVIHQMVPAEAARVSERTARWLARPVQDPKEPGLTTQQNSDVVKFSEMMPSKEAEPLCAQVVARILKVQAAEVEDNRTAFQIDERVPTLLAEISPLLAHVVANELASLRFRDGETIDVRALGMNGPGGGFQNAGPGSGGFINGGMWMGSGQSTNFPTLQSLLTDTSRAQRATRKAPVAAAPPSTAPAPPTPPYPCRLTTQELVELLKMPTCFGEVRHLILEHLGNRYDRKFANHWEFVRFAQEKGLKLDFTTPPRRPDPKASLQRLLDALPK